MLTPVLWAINLSSLKLDYEQAKAVLLPMEYLPNGKIYSKLN
jgi:hypothetical protein